MRKRRVTVSVINDLATDQRVRKICSVLQNENYDVHLIGRKLATSLPIERDYKVSRMRFLFNSGAAFYAFYNFRLFWKLLFSKTDVLYANDLDTLLANYLVSKLRSKTLIYDSHELFTEVPELKEGSFSKKTWLRIERWIFPKLKNVITVNESIAKIYRDKYNVEVNVVRNVPEKKNLKLNTTRKEMSLPEDKGILILQGSGINLDRGGEELVEAMQYLPNFHLLIVGSGDVLEKLKFKARSLNLENVQFVAKLPYEKMMVYTQLSDMGITLDKDTNLNYKYSLPNKIFDYLNAGIPVLSSDLPELRAIIEKFNVGCITKSHDPKEIARTVQEFFADSQKATECTKNASGVSKEINWESESQVLKSILGRIE